SRLQPNSSRSVGSVSLPPPRSLRPLQTAPTPPPAPFVYVLAVNRCRAWTTLAALAGPVLASGPFSPGAPVLPAALPASPMRDECSRKRAVVDGCRVPDRASTANDVGASVLLSVGWSSAAPYGLWHRGSGTRTAGE